MRIGTILAGAMLLAWGAISLGGVIPDTARWGFASTLFLVVMVSLVLGANRYLFRHSIVYTRSRAEAPTFWQRKRDDILINLIVLVAGAFLGWLVGVLMPKP